MQVAYAGIDIGGTFTDIVVHGLPGVGTAVAKVPTRPDDPAGGAIEGLGKALARASSPDFVLKAVRHATTIGTNAVVERNAPRAALAVTRGFRDVLHVGRQARPSLYDLRRRHPAPMIPRRLTLEIDERMAFDGTVERPVGEDDIEALAGLVEQESIEALGVCLLHAYRNGENEQELRRAIRQRCPGLAVCISSEVAPEIGEYERATTTAVNASVMPLMATYIDDLLHRLREIAPEARLYIMQSNGGAMGPDMAMELSARTVYSGPAAGLAGQAYFARQAGVDNAISLDVGGTSADVGIAIGGRVDETREGSVGGTPLRVPMLDVQSVGAGGGSIAWVDAGGALRVGPHSAGARPGPMCYGRGGRRPTVTDAHVVLGNIGPDSRLAGSYPVDRDRALEGVEEQIARPLGLAVEAAAAGIVDVANAAMTRALRRVTVERGHHPRDFALLAFGGAGPLHASGLAKALQIGTVVVPPAAGVLSALGALITDLRHDFTRTSLTPLDDDAERTVRDTFEALVRDARTTVEAEGWSDDDVALERWAEMRYLGQGHALRVELEPEELAGNTVGNLCERFHAEHARRYGFDSRREPVELVVVGVTARGAFEQIDPATGSVAETPTCSAARQVYIDGAWRSCPVRSRASIDTGERIEGPSIIEEQDCTTLLAPGDVVRLDHSGSLVVTVAGVPK